MKIIETKEISPGEFVPVLPRQRVLVGSGLKLVRREWRSCYSRRETLAIFLLVIPFGVAMFGFPEFRAGFVMSVARLFSWGPFG